MSAPVSNFDFPSVPTAALQELIDAALAGVGAAAALEMQATATHIQWRVVGGVAWTNLVALADIMPATTMYSGTYDADADGVVDDADPAGTNLAAALALKLDATATAADVDPAGATIAAALGGKSSTSHTHTGVYQAAGAYAAESHTHAGVYQPVGTYAVGDLTGLGTGVATALGVAVGSAGAPVAFNGALGTPSSGTLTNCTSLPLAGLVQSSAASRVLLRGSAAGAGAWQEGTLAGLTMNGTVLSNGWCWPIGLTAEGEVLSVGQKFATNLPFGFVATAVYVSLTDAGSGSACTFDVKTDSGVSILNAVLSLPAASLYAETATFSAAASSYTFAKNARLSVHIVTPDSGGTGTGAKVYITGYRTS